MTTEPTVSEALLKASDLLEKGWIQGNLYDGPSVQSSTKFCALGALGAAIPFVSNELWRRTVETLRSHIPARYNTGYIADWNNHPEMTQREVVDTFRRAAVSA